MRAATPVRACFVACLIMISCGPVSECTLTNSEGITERAWVSGMGPAAIEANLWWEARLGPAVQPAADPVRAMVHDLAGWKLGTFESREDGPIIQIDDDYQADAQVWAHELGHAMGLHHSETSGDLMSHVQSCYIAN